MHFQLYRVYRLDNQVKSVKIKFESNMTESKDLENQISSLPSGYITKRSIKGRIYYSHQGTSGGRQFSHSVSKEEAEVLMEQIAMRKKLEKELKSIQAKVNAESRTKKKEFNTNVILGTALSNFAEPSKKFQKRDCYSTIEKYINRDVEDKVCVVYGLRRTGKTTLLKQLILSFNKAQREKTAYIKCTASDTVASLNKDIITLQNLSYKYLLIDEVTLMNDFIDSSSLFSDVYAAQGMKIILSGTDSLGFHFAISNELYDRAIMIHTTFISFREHSRLLGINDVDEYIRYGGTLKAGELDFENNELNTDDASFRDNESTRYYIDTAICSNIQHSLECFKDGKYFRHLMTLYEADELTNAINRIIESLNHNFTVKVITRLFKSRDFGSAAQELRSEKDEKKRTDILDRINSAPILETLKKILSIKEKEEQTIGITNVHIEEIKEYLKSLDLIEKMNVETRFADTPELNASDIYYIFTQPGMRYCQAQALIYSLLKNPQISGIDIELKKLITNKISEDVMGNMLEDIILLETKKTLGKDRKNKKEVFKLIFSTGEFDMVIQDIKNSTCEIFEIKHSSQIITNQYRHLINPEYTSLTEKIFGKITKKAVIYKGSPQTLANGIEYINAEDYLTNLI